MSESESQPSATEVEQPWKQSAKGYIYCMWENLPDDIRSQLQQEDRFGISWGGFHYNVKRNDNGGFVVFRNTVEEYQENRRQYFKNSVQRIVEVKALPIEQANQLLATSDFTELIGTDPVKILNGELYLIIGKKMWKKREGDSS
jgi:hypothetical protein